jgi:hypothetical protein
MAFLKINEVFDNSSEEITFKKRLSQNLKKLENNSLTIIWKELQYRFSNGCYITTVINICSNGFYLTEFFFIRPRIPQLI